MEKSTKPNDLRPNYPVFQREFSIRKGRGAGVGSVIRVNEGCLASLSSLLRLLGRREGLDWLTRLPQQVTLAPAAEAAQNQVPSGPLPSAYKGFLLFLRRSASRP